MLIIFQGDIISLKNESATVLLWNMRFRILCGVASALVYMHEEWKERVVHRDIKTGNVLLDSSSNARLVDFGLARLYHHNDENLVTSAVAGTLRYVAPECSRKGKVTDKWDVYIFGAVCGQNPTRLVAQTFTNGRTARCGDSMEAGWIMQDPAYDGTVNSLMLNWSNGTAYIKSSRLNDFVSREGSCYSDEKTEFVTRCSYKRGVTRHNWELYAIYYCKYGTPERGKKSMLSSNFIQDPSTKAKFDPGRRDRLDHDLHHFDPSPM